MKTLYRAGDTGVGLCEVCRAQVPTLMEYRTFVPEGCETSVADVLVDVCRQCGEIVSYPPQSAARINANRADLTQSVGEGIQARIPRILEDALDLVAATVGGAPKVLRSAILRFYIQRAARSRTLMEAIRVRADDPIAECKADRKLTVRMHQHRKTAAMHVAGRFGIDSEAKLLRGVLLLIADDFEIALRACQETEPTRRPAVPRADKRRKLVGLLAEVVA